MTHEAGLKAAHSAYWDYSNDLEGDMDMGKAIKAYLSASGMVLLPKEPTKKMLAAASKAMSPGNCPTQDFISNSQKHKIRYQAMVAAYTEIPLTGELQDGA